MKINKQTALNVLAERLNKAQKQHVRGYLSAPTLQEIRLFAAAVEKGLKEARDETGESRA